VSHRQGFQKQNHTEMLAFRRTHWDCSLEKADEMRGWRVPLQGGGWGRGGAEFPPGRVVAQEKTEPGSVSGSSASPGTPLDLSGPPLSYLPNGHTEQHMGLL